MKTKLMKNQLIKTNSGAHLADTVVVKETQLSANVSGVVPVMSSHCAGDVPPVSIIITQSTSYTSLQK